MNQKEIDEIQARCEAATAGPWYWRISNWGGVGIGSENGSTIATYTSALNAMNAKFIAHARQDVPDLLDALEEAQRTIESGRNNFRVYVEQQAMIHNQEREERTGLVVENERLKEERDRLLEIVQDDRWNWHRTCRVCGALFRRIDGVWTGNHRSKCVNAKTT